MKKGLLETFSFVPVEIVDIKAELFLARTMAGLRWEELCTIENQASPVVLSVINSSRSPFLQYKQKTIWRPFIYKAIVVFIDIKVELFLARTITVLRSEEL